MSPRPATVREIQNRTIQEALQVANLGMLYTDRNILKAGALPNPTNMMWPDPDGNASSTASRGRF